MTKSESLPRALRLSERTRRRLGVTYTPEWIVAGMIKWAKTHGTPGRIVDVGAGTGNFTIAAAAAFPDAQVIAIEINRKSADHLRAIAKGTPHANRIQVVRADYLALKDLPSVEGKTLYLGNPPYVRHHLISQEKKRSYLRLCREFGLHENTKAGLHLHFFLQTRRLARQGDFGIFIAAAEWIHANYGSGFRKLLTDGMGGISIDAFPVDDFVFPEIMTTAAVVCFEIGKHAGAIAFSEIKKSDDLAFGAGRKYPIEVLQNANQWSSFARQQDAQPASGETVSLGELFHVRRGQVTGANKIWIYGPHCPEIPDCFLFPSITKGAEVLAANGAIATKRHLRKIVDLPTDFRSLRGRKLKAAKQFREWARRQGAALPYVARQRQKWWSIELYDPPAIICTYMGRRPPAFATNTARAHIINIAHGLSPRRPMSRSALQAIVGWLNAHVSGESGRAYQGGLIKFEPSDIAAIRIPVDFLPARLRGAILAKKCKPVIS